jgi:hypothetical protein
VLEPVFGGRAPGPVGAEIVGCAKLQQPLQLHRIKIEQQLTGFGLHGAALDIDANAFSVGVDFQLRKRIVNAAQFVAERR